jgi:hypothetical protein
MHRDARFVVCAEAITLEPRHGAKKLILGVLNDCRAMEMRSKLSTKTRVLRRY